MSLLGTLRQSAQDKVKGLEVVLKSAQEAVERISKLRAKQLSFRVEITSLWPDLGGQNSTATVKGSLEEAMRQAIVEFRQLNHCGSGSLQGKFKVVAILPSEPKVEMAVPESIWAHLTPK